MLSFSLFSELVAQDTNYANILYFCFSEIPGALYVTRYTGQVTQKWGISSVGLERLLDRQEVTGSNPVCPTLKMNDL